MLKAISNLSLCALLILCISWPVVGQDAGTSKPAALKPSNVQELLACLDRAAANLQDYTVSGTTEADGKKQTFKMAYKRPNLVRIDTRAGQVSVQPNGDIKGRLGRGPFGNVTQTLSRRDKRLKDAEGIPFYESDFVSLLARVQAQIKGGAAAAMQAETTAYILEIRSGDTVWKYRLGSSDFSLQESSRWVNGKQVEIARYTDFHANTGIKTDYFKF